MSKSAFQTAIKSAIRSDLTAAGFNLTEGQADVLADSIGDVVAEQVVSYLSNMLAAGVPVPNDGGAALKTTMQSFLSAP